MATFADTLAEDRSKVPGAMQTETERIIHDLGTLTFQEAPAGWMTMDGNPRREKYRRYMFTPDPAECSDCLGSGRDYSKSVRGRQCPLCKGTGNMSRRRQLVSVTTLIGYITPKDGLAPWAEARGIEGAVEAVRLGLVEPDDPASAANAVAEVRAARLGADRARDDAADRGLNVHSLLEHYMHTGVLPEPGDHIPEHYGYVTALRSFLESTGLEPVAVEEMVCDPDAGYAGRYDLVAKDRDGRTGLFDAKTQEKGGIYPGAHLQLGLLERGMIACGDGAMDFKKVVVFAADGEYRTMDALCTPSLIESAIRYHRLLAPVTSGCESKNRVEREARKLAA